MPLGLIAAAELRAAETGVGGDRALIAADVISEEAYLAALTAVTGIRFEPLDDLPRDACPLPDEKLLDAAAVGILPLRDADQFHFVVAPRSLAARRLTEAARNDSDLAARISVTTADRMQQFIARHAAQAISQRASFALRTAHPEFSAGRGARRTPAAIALLATLALAAMMAMTAASKTFAIVDCALGGIFLSWAALRILGPLTTRDPSHPRHELGDDRLPIYTIIVALYREAAAVKDLVAALRCLDYPKEKLDIKFVLEPDDRATLARLQAMRLGAPFEIIVAPAGAPRTKPRALNAALPFARGTFVAVFDAEDRPERDQLKRALDAFATHGDQLVCVQARLTIDNTADSWLARVFTAEYAGLFDVFLPCLAARRWPLPLGGSSNHFRTEVLRRVGAWDPYNVTEDADLGLRLARLGYRTTVIASTTYEEAPARFLPWLKQRTRWMKGWVQTWLVHMRTPIALLRSLGPAGFAVFQLLVGGSVLAALVHPFFLIAFLGEFTSTRFDADPALTLQTSLHGAALLAGYMTSLMLGIIGLARRRLLHCAWALALIPFYWLLLSLAAWRALYQLLRDPYRWEKTEHGLARNSRLAADATAAVKNTAAVRSRIPLAGA
jgi:cellulose synthase/poly-beta-1,6-N-acetylglucosamine synthase-like glycosyltransferase